MGAGRIWLAPPGELRTITVPVKVLSTVLSANPKLGIEKRSPEGRSRSDGGAGMEMMSLVAGFPHRGVPLILGPVDHQICGMDARLLTGGI